MKSTPNREQLLHDVAEWWAKALGMIDSIQDTAERIAHEASDPASPLYAATSAENWKQFAGALQDCGAINCHITFAPDLPDPLRTLAGKRGAK